MTNCQEINGSDLMMIVLRAIGQHGFYRMPIEEIHEAVHAEVGGCRELYPFPDAKWSPYVETVINLMADADLLVVEKNHVRPTFMALALFKSQIGGEASGAV